MSNPYYRIPDFSRGGCVFIGHVLLVLHFKELKASI
jgi:hypothetical protein